MPASSQRGPVNVARRQVAAVLTLVLALLATTTGNADAQVNDARAKPVQIVETLRLHCGLDSIDGQRGVLCEWSEATNPTARAYQLYRIVDGSPRQLLSTVGANGRRAHFDTNVEPGSNLVYGVIAVNRVGRLIGRSEPVHISYEEPTEQLRMACAAESVEGQRGVLCRWSEPETNRVRGYLVYRIVGSGERELVARVPADGRQASFDTEVEPGAVHIYGVTAIAGHGDVVAVGGPRRVLWPQAD